MIRPHALVSFGGAGGSACLWGRGKIGHEKDFIT